ncbi:response regulator [Nostoc sp. 'Lobaria pulmonaria (5183) cyanobiont']|uniref:response regulator n=1 Tax=Nostoc sp. 'Lobaria pulmonaria (5183) cyanobiont' TaxID=1618022 RepID=UPI000CF354F3|nr:response regulator [Nostoc sp. 'Lobaria pulmonaria (5183) cyanobiont']AVH71439.1 response regulator receiver protein/heterocyst pattern formation protein PatA [Nostoc sp. 'Lobaria pulmonaria (5183) cyanobiont']
MKTLPISRYRFFQKLQPLTLLKKITGKSVTGCLQVFSTSGSWSIYVDEGKLIYACYSEKMFEPLYRNLQRLSQQISTLPDGIKDQLRAIFETGIENQAIPNPDYLAICWLVNQKYISSSQAAMLIEQLALEVLESFLNLEEGSYEFIPESFLDDMPKFCHLNLRLLVEECLTPQNVGVRVSVFEREASHKEGVYRQTLPSYQSHTSQFFQINELQPKVKTTPKLPKINGYKAAAYSINTNENRGQQIIQPSVDRKIYTILCIDDSPTVLNAIKSYLDEQTFSVIGVTDSLKALMQIIRIKPDIILLDILMPNLDGYELCSLLRKHSYFKNTPVIMVSEKVGFLDRAKAKMVRASGYLTKPFKQGDLLKVIFQHIV